MPATGYAAPRTQAVGQQFRLRDDWHRFEHGVPMYDRSFSINIRYFSGVPYLYGMPGYIYGGAFYLAWCGPRPVYSYGEIVAMQAGNLMRGPTRGEVLMREYNAVNQPPAEKNSEEVEKLKLENARLNGQVEGFEKAVAGFKKDMASAPTTIPITKTVTNNVYEFHSQYKTNLCYSQAKGYIAAYLNELFGVLGHVEGHDDRPYSAFIGNTPIILIRNGNNQVVKRIDSRKYLRESNTTKILEDSYSQVSSLDPQMAEARKELRIIPGTYDCAESRTVRPQGLRQVEPMGLTVSPGR